ncbi:MAG: hypothetical protein GX640_03500 [Fibrobacter sp.]|mgnify:CR=1 FL=1|nr:hypothetical protein [Fibrobacter sp.]
MKKNIQTPQDLIISLASKGDPTAFYSLVVKQLEKKYLHLRSNGTSHDDATQAVLSEAASLFDKLKGIHPLDFDEWLDSQIEPIPPAEDVAEFSIENNLSHECNIFLRKLQQSLIRQVSKMDKKKNFNLFFQFLSKRLLNRPLIITITAIIVIILSFYLYLVGSRSNIRIVYNNSHKEHSISIPFNTNIITDSIKTTPTAIPVVKDTTADSITPPPPPLPPVAPPPPPVKKVVVRPRKTEPEQSSIIPATPAVGISEQPVERNISENQTAAEVTPATGKTDSQNE